MRDEEPPRFPPTRKADEPSDYQVFRMLEDQWRDGDGAMPRLIKDGLARGIIKEVKHPDFPIVKEPWYIFVRRPEE